MDKDKRKVTESQPVHINRPKDVNRSIIFFNSFEEAELHGLKEMASHTFEERLTNLEIMRKRSYYHLLLPNGQWPPLERTITIIEGTIG